jgi:hypothetical protein
MMVVCSDWWNEWQGTPEYSEETCSSAALTMTNPTQLGLETEPPRQEASD